jgi:hypothetical protein
MAAPPAPPYEERYQLLRHALKATAASRESLPFRQIARSCQINASDSSFSFRWANTSRLADKMVAP